MPVGSNIGDLEILLLQRAERLHDSVRKRIPSKLRSVISPEDVLQDVWIAAFRTFSVFQNDRPDAFDRWLNALATRKLLDALRRQARLKRGGAEKFATAAHSESSFLALIEKVAGDQTTPSSQGAKREATHAVQIALARLPDVYREAITLRYLRACSITEIASYMNKTPAAVHSLLHRGLRMLAELLGPPGQFLSGFSDVIASIPHSSIDENSRVFMGAGHGGARGSHG